MPGPMANPTLPSNVPRPGQVPSNGPSSGPSNGQPRIKQEPNVEPQHFKGMTPGYTNNVAQERAAQQLQQRFGPEAQAQINRLQQQSAMNMPPQYAGGQPPNNQQRPPMGGQYPQVPPNQMTDKQRTDAMEYQRRAAMGQAPMKPQAPPQNAPQPQPVANGARTDGADDWDEFVAQRRSDAAQASDNIFTSSDTLRQHVEQQSKAMEGGGLMLPLAEQRILPQSKHGKGASDVGEGSSSSYATLVAAQSSNPKHFPAAAQFDGPADDNDDEDGKKPIKDELFDDDDDEDEDAINSDLDDPDDNAIEEEQDEGRPNQIMLCTYDKVQRVKNKWKCTLKDGVLNTGGKE